jgi:hypothetical protein
LLASLRGGGGEQAKSSIELFTEARLPGLAID